jgi:anti-sigma-K factor RskA
MSTPNNISPEDLALFAMQLLSRDETAEVEAYLEQSAEGRRELARIQGDLAIYAHTVDLHSPPAQVRERLMKQVAREKRVAPIERPAPVETANRASTMHKSAVPAVTSGAGKSGARTSGAGTSGAGTSGAGTSGARTSGARNIVAASDEPELRTGRGSGSGPQLIDDDLPRRSMFAKVFPWVGWAAAAGLGVAAGNLYRQRDSLYQERDNLHATAVAQATKLDNLTTDTAAAREVLDALTDTTAKRVTLVKAKGASAPLPEGRATYVADKGTLIFIANNLEPLSPLKTYELWLIPAAAGSAPIPAGTFRPDERGNASVILPLLPKGVEAKAFGVTVEDKDGATTPTLPIILVGA